MADSSHNDYCDDDIWDDYCIDSELVVALVDLDITVGSPGNPVSRTSLDSTHTLDVVYWSASSPYAPFNAQPVFALWNHFGIYAFGKVLLPEEIRNIVFYHDSTLLHFSPITFAAEPMGANLVGSVGSGQRPTGTVLLDNASGWWDRRVDEEAFLGLGAGLFMIIRGTFTVPQLVGTVGSIMLNADATVEIAYGAFVKDRPFVGERIYDIR